MGLINFLFVAMTQGDLVLVKHFFSEYNAGIYASAAMLGKAVMYLPGALVLSLFPIVSARSAGRQATGHILARALGLNAILSGGGALALAVFPGLIVGAFFGERYLPAARLVGLFGLAMFPMGVISILMSYSLARGRIRSILPLSGASVVELCGILLFHDSLRHILLSMLFAGCVGILVFGVFLLADRHSTSATSA
jgi:O-antigen/teichoic acid export membrane protein